MMTSPPWRPLLLQRMTTLTILSNPMIPMGLQRGSRRRRGRRRRRRRRKGKMGVPLMRVRLWQHQRSWCTSPDDRERPQQICRELRLRMTGQTNVIVRVKCDLLPQCCKTKYRDKQVKQIVTNPAMHADMLVALERQYPSYETDLSIRTAICNLGMLPNNPKVDRICELLDH